MDLTRGTKTTCLSKELCGIADKGERMVFLDNTQLRLNNQNKNVQLDPARGTPSVKTKILDSG